MEHCNLVTSEFYSQMFCMYYFTVKLDSTKKGIFFFLHFFLLFLLHFNYILEHFEEDFG